MPTSVVMVSYHTGPVLWLAVQTVLAEEGLAELVIVNNGNEPDVEERLRLLVAENSKAKLISGHGNVGFAKACNLGVREATGRYVLLLNPDCKLPAQALSMFEYALEDHEGMLAGAYLQNPNGTEQRGGRRNIITPLNAVVEGVGLQGLLPQQRVNFNGEPMPSEVHEVPAISGACMFMRREAYLEMGGMDEGYFLHMEDMDLCLRVRERGGKILCVPQVKVVHFLSTSDASPVTVEWHKTRGFVRYFYKHFRGRYFPGFLFLASAGVVLRFLLKSALACCKRRAA